MDMVSESGQVEKYYQFADCLNDGGFVMDFEVYRGDVAGRLENAGDNWNSGRYPIGQQRRIDLSTLRFNGEAPQVGDSLQIFVRVVAGVDKRGPAFLFAPNGHAAVHRAAGTTLFYGVDLL
jgi:hypothetical protein